MALEEWRRPGADVRSLEGVYLDLLACALALACALTLALTLVEDRRVVVVDVEDEDDDGLKGVLMYDLLVRGVVAVVVLKLTLTLTLTGLRLAAKGVVRYLELGRSRGVLESLTLEEN